MNGILIAPPLWADVVIFVVACAGTAMWLMRAALRTEQQEMRERKQYAHVPDDSIDKDYACGGE